MCDLYNMKETLADSYICSNDQHKIMQIAKVEPCVNENESETEFILDSMDHLAFSSDDEDCKPFVFCGFSNKKVCANKRTKPGNGFGNIAHQHYSITMVDFRGSIADVTTAQQQEIDPTFVIARTKPNNTLDVSQRHQPLRKSLSDLGRDQRERLASVARASINCLDLSVPSHNMTSSESAELSKNSEQNISFVSSTTQQSPAHQLPPDNTSALVTGKRKRKRQVCVEKRQMPLRKSLSNSDRIYRERLSNIKDTVSSPLNSTEISSDILYNSESPEVSHSELPKIGKNSDLNISISGSTAQRSTVKQLSLDNTSALLTARRKSSNILERQMPLRQSLADSGQGQLKQITSVEGSALSFLNVNENSQGVAPNSVTLELSNSELDKFDKEPGLNISTSLAATQLSTAQPIDNTPALLTARRNSKSLNILERQMPSRKSISDSGQGQLEKITSVERSGLSSLNVNENSQGFTPNSVTPELSNSELDKLAESGLNISTSLAATQLSTAQQLPLDNAPALLTARRKSKSFNIMKRQMPLRKSLSDSDRTYREQLSFVEGTGTSLLNSSEISHDILYNSESTEVSHSELPKIGKNSDLNISISGSTAQRSTAQQLPLDNTPALLTTRRKSKSSNILERQMPPRKSSDSGQGQLEKITSVERSGLSSLNLNEISQGVAPNSVTLELSNSELDKLDKESDPNISTSLSTTQLPTAQQLPLYNTATMGIVNTKRNKLLCVSKRLLPMRQALSIWGREHRERSASAKGTSIPSLNSSKPAHDIAYKSKSTELSKIGNYNKNVSMTKRSPAQQVPLDNTPGLVTAKAKKKPKACIVKRKMPLRKSLSNSDRIHREQLSYVEDTVAYPLNSTEISHDILCNSKSPESSYSELPKIGKNSDLNIRISGSTAQLSTAQQLPLDNTSALLTARRKSKTLNILEQQMSSRKSISDSGQGQLEKITSVELSGLSSLNANENSQGAAPNSITPELSNSELDKLNESGLNISTSLAATKLSTAQQLPLDNTPALLTARRKSKSSNIMKRQMPFRQSLIDPGQGQLEQITSVEGSALSFLNVNENSEGVTPNSVTLELSNSELDKLDESGLNISTSLAATAQQLPLDNTPALLTARRNSKSFNIMKRQMPLRKSLSDSDRTYREQLSYVEGTVASLLNFSEISNDILYNSESPEVSYSELPEIGKNSDLNMSISGSTSQRSTAQQLPLDNTSALLTARRNSKSLNILERQMPSRKSISDSGQGQLEKITSVERSGLSSLNVNENSQGVTPNSVTLELSNSELDKLDECGLNISTSLEATQLSTSQQLQLDNTPALLTARRKSKSFNIMKRQMPLRKSLSDSDRTYREQLSYVEDTVSSLLNFSEISNDILYNSESPEVSYSELPKIGKSSDLNISISGSTAQRSTAQQLPADNTPALLTAKKNSKSSYIMKRQMPLRQSLSDSFRIYREVLSYVEDTDACPLNSTEISHDILYNSESAEVNNSELPKIGKNSDLNISISGSTAQRSTERFTSVGSAVTSLNLSNISQDTLSILESKKCKNRKRTKFELKLFNEANSPFRLDYESKMLTAQRENHLINDRQLAIRRRDSISESGRKKKVSIQQNKKPKPIEPERNEHKFSVDYIRRKTETVARYWERIVASKIPSKGMKRPKKARNKK